MRYVYLMECGEFVKIGSSGDPDDRRSEFQVGNPYPVKVLWRRPFQDAYAIEMKLHDYFHKERVSGEWFRLEDPIRKVEQAIQHITGEDPVTGEILRLWFALSPDERTILMRRILKLKIRKT